MRGSNGGPALSLWLLLGMMIDATLTSETRSCDLYLDFMPGFDFESPPNATISEQGLDIALMPGFTDSPDLMRVLRPDRRTESNHLQHGHDARGHIASSSYMQHDNGASASSASENDTNNSDYSLDRCLQHDTYISRHNSPKGHGNATDLTSEHGNTNERTILLNCKNTADIHGATKTTMKRKS
jgi:hypothetical protein